jgi:hypothetical protein
MTKKEDVTRHCKDKNFFFSNPKDQMALEGRIFNAYDDEIVWNRVDRWKNDSDTWQRYAIAAGGKEQDKVAELGSLSKKTTPHGVMLEA